MFEGLVKMSQQAVEEGDYYKDGLLYCGKCHTKKQRYVVLGGKERLVGCLCTCGTINRDSAQREEEEEQRRLGMDVARSTGFPDRAMMEWTFDADDGSNPELTALCKRYVDNFDEIYRDGKGLLLYGSVGTGKTYMASCIANALIDKGKTALVTNFARIANELQKDFNHRQDYLDNLNNFSLLVIDDLAAERDTEYMNEIIMTVIDARYRARKPLIVTTNLQGKELTGGQDRTKQRIFSRLYAMCIPYEVKGKDRRREELKASMKDYAWLLGKGENA